MLLLEDLEVYKVAMEVGEIVWKIVDRWTFFQKDTLGKQFTRAADSIALNISEGYGRFFYKENKNFCFYSRGSAYEVKSILIKSKNRDLLSNEEFDLLQNKLNHYFRMINPYIKSIGRNEIQ